MMMALDPVTLSERHPHSVFILVLSVLSGVPLLINGVEPGSVEALLPSWAVFLWALALVGGSVAALAGIFLPNRPVGLIVEQVGNGAIAPTAILYSVALLLSTWPEGAYVSGLVCGWGISCGWRWWQIQSFLGKVQAQTDSR